MRSDRPDHRHRCFAEKRPAPRAIAHQEAFCLSATFPACPTFQDWARREAAQARGSSRGSASSGGPASVTPSGMAGGVGAAAAAAAAAGAADTGGRSEMDGAVDDGEPVEPPNQPPELDDVDDRADGDEDAAGYEPPEPGWRPDDMPARNVSRGWAEPPPWVGGPEGKATARSSRTPGSSDPGPTDVDHRPPAGLAASRWLSDVEPGDELDADEEDSPQRGSTGSATPAFLAGRAAATDEPDAEPDRELAALVTRTRPAGGPTRRNPRPMAGQQRASRRQPPHEDAGPSWERPRRFEAYPTLKTRVGMPSIPRIGVAVLALVVAAVLLFMIPALFFGKPDAGSTPSPSFSAAPSVSFVATTPPAPTPVTYEIKKGDNLSKIAKSFGVTQAQLLTANPQIKDPNKIKVGDVINIPSATPSEIIDSTSPSPNGSASSAP